MVTCWSYSLLGSTGDSAPAERITALPAAPLALFFSFSLLFCWSRHFLLNSYDLHPTTLFFISSSFFSFSYSFHSSNSILSILRLSISFCSNSSFSRTLLLFLQISFRIFKRRCSPAVSSPHYFAF
ncbi:uncharacterized protein EURHEDRAFT_357665 [Aspergillus ruber CBS 135680]|uniref:Uncharacterized protein n=1 Tax=Aspergillus ruber (strain CBS 135680) TaxID=1388766 RepID=A0A017SI79_ASPRC|nr:uncharacterized protein EURHEDRAFT_357665 [Aspergillus ruber CBS 135680]EYE96638.1 hypothetical protein EURHEDRAFT_357665 [Aspergillus ruber CBS 135680]